MLENRVPLVKQQYEYWPYPKVPLVAKLHRDSLWQINLGWMARRMGREVSGKPRIWIAGCGTFQPYTFAQANPGASILATDLSEASLKIAKNRCRLHGVKNVNFRPIDLSNPETYPNEQFDLIECYGVLMSLPNPGKVLEEFHKRLKPNGILRLMVYTHYGRKRVFQIQKIARLLGLNPTDKAHPKVLRNLIAKLPENHPLKSAFFDYPDSKNFPGIVDGFLHASDRGFTGEGLSKILDEAGFELGFCYHRPWGNPDFMAEKLGIKGQDPAFWLHYLDLWQSLKSNFILCAVPKGKRESALKNPEKKHPLFDFKKEVGVRHKLRLLKLGVLGAKLQSRTHEEPVDLTAAEVRALISGKGEISPKVSEVLGDELVRSKPFFGNGLRFPSPSDPWMVEIGNGPNPLYRHLFDAYAFSENPEKEWERWKPYSRPLESEQIPWGLTPAATFENQKPAISDWLRNQKAHKVVPISEAKLVREEEKLGALKEFLSRQKGVEIPADKSSLRMLWVLLMSHQELFLEFEVA